MNKILKVLGVITCCFSFVNLFSAQPQLQSDAVVQQKLTETKLEQILNLLKEVKDLKNQPNTLTAKTTSALGTVIRETLLIGGSVLNGLVTTIVLANKGTIQNVTGTTNMQGTIYEDKDTFVFCVACVGTVAAISLGTYGLLKFLLLIKNKLSEHDPLDKETKEKLNQIQKLLEQVKFMQELKDSGLSQQIQNPIES